jgi:hypothetical protein
MSTHTRARKKTLNNLPSGHFLKLNFGAVQVAIAQVDVHVGLGHTVGYATSEKVLGSEKQRCTTMDEDSRQQLEAHF